MQKIKIKFVDFWFGFSPEHNYFFNLLSQIYQLELSNLPDILIYSCYGAEHLKYKCTKVFYAAENVRPDFTGCDYAISFDYNKDPRHFRLPLYALYIDQIGACEKLILNRSRKEALDIWRSKTKFCCMVVSNGLSKKRLQLFEKLSKYKQVDSGGKVMNNVGGPVKDKMNFIKDYRFVFSFENASYPGYSTEKIIEPLLADSIPLYWGDPLIGKDFNTKCFLNLDSSKSDEDFINEIIAADEDEERAIRMLMEPKFTNGKIPDDINKVKLNQFFKSLIIGSLASVPVSRTNKKYIHFYKVKKSYYTKRVKGLINRFTER